VLENTAAKTVKMSKRREGSTDEDSSARAERLTANGDPGTSKLKSFLSFLDSKIMDNMASLGGFDRDICREKYCEHERSRAEQFTSNTA
jgi:hypothetical protein